MNFCSDYFYIETEQEMAELQEALSGKDGELAENRKTAAVERAILEGGGKNVKAILALLCRHTVGPRRPRAPHRVPVRHERATR